MLIINWTSRNINIYPFLNDRVQTKPQSVIPFHLTDKDLRPHGMCFSRDGNYLAVVYGSFEDSPWVVVLYHVQGLGTAKAKLKPCSYLKKNQNIKGVPKGIAFSPDGTSVVITFTKTNSLGIFSIDLDKGVIHPIARQEIMGASTRLHRPEDIAFSTDGAYCAVSNSSGDTISFYQYDKHINRFVSDLPFKIIDKKDADLHFPHGLAFSHDGKYFAVTQFGLPQINPEGYLLSWGINRIEGVFLFKINDD